MLIAVSGLPGTGKSTVADALARRLHAVRVPVDPIEDARRRLEHRPPTWTYVPAPTWEDVVQRASGYEPWSGRDHLLLDADAPVDSVVAHVLARLHRL